MNQDAGVELSPPRHATCSHRHPPPQQVFMKSQSSTAALIATHWGLPLHPDDRAPNHSATVPRRTTPEVTRHPDFCPLRPSYPSTLSSVNTFSSRAILFPRAPPVGASPHPKRKDHGATRLTAGDRTHHGSVCACRTGGAEAGTETAYAIILPGSHRISCGKTTHNARPIMMQMTNGQTPRIMSAIVTPSSDAAEPRR